LFRASVSAVSRPKPVLQPVIKTTLSADIFLPEMTSHYAAAESIPIVWAVRIACYLGIMPALAIERFKVRSAGNVDISVQKTGAGPALLLVHGALLNATAWWGPLLRRIAGDFTVYAMDRRGRAPSGDAEDYSLPLEGEDIIQVAEAIGTTFAMLAHSYGAVATLDAIDRLKAISHLILYEPPLTLTPMGRPDSEKVIGDMERALRDGDREEAVTIFLRDQVRMPRKQRAAFRWSPKWPVAIEVAHTLPRESRVVNTYRDWTQKLGNCNIPATVFLGSETTASELKDGSMFVSRSIPGCALKVLQGQGHNAMLDAPDFFTATVVEILRGTPQGEKTP
jgi:pimeloyl-ACP methyl ester carboxylesterase